MPIALEAMYGWDTDHRNVQSMFIQDGRVTEFG
jgi:hypothetical protein